MPQHTFQAPSCAELIALVLQVIALVRAQSQADVAAVIEANNGYYSALSALDMAAMENVWAHEDYVSQVGPRNAAPLIGWATIQPYLVKTWANFSELKVRPVDPRARINGNVGWVIGQEEVGSTSRLKLGHSDPEPAECLRVACEQIRRQACESLDVAVPRYQSASHPGRDECPVRSLGYLRATRSSNFVGGFNFGPTTSPTRRIWYGREPQSRPWPRSSLKTAARRQRINCQQRPRSTIIRFRRTCVFPRCLTTIPSYRLLGATLFQLPSISRSLPIS
jgi:hypothetical protein